MPTEEGVFTRCIPREDPRKVFEGGAPFEIPWNENRTRNFSFTSVSPVKKRKIYFSDPWPEYPMKNCTR